MSHTAANLVCTSVEDLRSTLPFIFDIPLLKQALALSVEQGGITRQTMIERRIKQLRKEAKS